jgi:type I restriction enzyme S subunit
MTEVALHEICELKKGHKPNILSDEQLEGWKPYILIQSFDGSRTSFSNDAKCTECVEDDTLIVTDGARSGLASFGHAGYIGSTIAALAPNKEKIFPKYLYYFVQSHFDLLNSRTKGATIPHLDKAYLMAMTLYLPSLPEQERIVRLLDEAESLRATRELANERMEQFVPALFQEIFGDPVTNEKGWQVFIIEDLLLRSPNYGSMIPVRNNKGEWINLRVANIQNGTLDLTDTKYIDLPDESISRHTVQDGDLLLARAIGSREHLGKCVVVFPGNNKWAFDSHMMRVRPNQEKILPLFLHAFLTSSGGRDIFLQNTRQSAVQFNINTKEFTSIQIPVPPLPA